MTQAVVSQGLFELAASLPDLVVLGDFVSLHLAARLDVDPGPVPYLTELKTALSER